MHRRRHSSVTVDARRRVMTIRKQKTTKGTRYEARVRAPDGRERCRWFGTRREALDWEAEQRAARATGMWVDPRGAVTPFDVWARRWLDDDLAKSPGARSTDGMIIRAHLIPTLGARPLGQVTPLAVKRLVGSWTSTGAAPRT